MIFFVIIWLIASFVIVWAMIGYPALMLLLGRLILKKEVKQEPIEPTVTIMAVAHNEEKVIEDKLNNLLQVEYPEDKLKFLIALDFCTDKTADIVNRFISEHPNRSIRVHQSERHLGKTNAQNETQTLCDTEILVMTDANAMFEFDAVRKLVQPFADPTVAYVTGCLKYRNAQSNKTAVSEGFYWKLDLRVRAVESRLQTITAGNGAIYAVRNVDYIQLQPIRCHDSWFPLRYALAGRRALYVPEAVAWEKAGESDGDEFKRKVRMNRGILGGIFYPQLLNVVKYRWFTFFYFGHRTCRYLLWLMHILVLLTNVPLAIRFGGVWLVFLSLQVAFYALGIYGWRTESKNKYVRMVSYYLMTVLAQWHGVINNITGKAKPVWEKAESTR